MPSFITTCSQGTFQNTIVNIDPSCSRYLPASSCSTRESEAPKTESRKMRFFRGSNNAGSKLPKPYLSSTYNILSTPPPPPSYSEVVNKHSFGMPDIESPVRVPNNKSDGGLSEFPKNNRFLQLVARNKSRAAVNDVLSSTSSCTPQSKSMLPISTLREFGEVIYKSLHIALGLVNVKRGFGVQPSMKTNLQRLVQRQ